MTPFCMSTNLYIEMQKSLAERHGFEVRPFSIKHLFIEGGLWGLLSRRNIVLVQWLEVRPFVLNAPKPRLSLSGTALFFLYLGLLALTPASVVFFVHDHAVHDTEELLRAASQWFMLLARKVADRRVVHDPNWAQPYGAIYLPHPLYWDRPGMPDSEPLAQIAGPVRETGAPMRCALLGAIRPYKAIDEVLRIWPVGIPLSIAGRSTPEMLTILRAVIEERGLQDSVAIDPEFQSEEAFERRLRETDVLILPHASDTALVSGAFFEAIGRVPFILARRSSFMAWARSQFDGIYLFDQTGELPELLARINRESAAVDTETLERVRVAFGRETCLRQWGAFFGSLDRSSLDLTVDA